MPQLTRAEQARSSAQPSWSLWIPLDERIIATLDEVAEPLTDAQLAAALKVGHQAVNKTCRTLEQQGMLRRPKAVGSSILNVVPLPAKVQPAE